MTKPLQAGAAGHTTASAAGTGAPADTGTSVAALEELFGEATDPHNPVGHQAVLDADERHSTPTEAERLLDQYGLGAEFVPAELGGRLTHLEHLIEVTRAVYRRDPALGLGYGAGTFMAAANVWTSGRPEQRAELARTVLDGGKVACAYHELAHGNDLSQAELTAYPAPSERPTLLLNGRKEVVANLRQASRTVLFARTSPDGGPRSHSQLLVDPAQFPDDTVRDLGRYSTTGMRGVRLGGLSFTDTPVPPESVVGTEGSGVETALRSFQLTRIAVPGMTVGLLDTALRTAVRCAEERQLYGSAVTELPLSRSVLSEAFADVLLADAFTAVAARTVHTAPRQAGPYACAVKYLVPTILMRAVKDLSALLSSQFYLREGRHAIFQKLLRDVLPSSFGHASRASCQTGMLPHLPSMAHRAWGSPGQAPLPEATFQRDVTTPPLDLGALSLTPGARDPLARSLVSVCEALPTSGNGGERQVADAARKQAAALRELAAECATLPPRELGPTASASTFALTARWAGLLATSACVNTWWHDPTSSATGSGDPVWVLAALHRLGTHLGQHRDRMPPELTEPLFTELWQRVEKGETLDLRRRPTRT